MTDDSAYDRIDVESVFGSGAEGVQEEEMDKVYQWLRRQIGFMVDDERIRILCAELSFDKETIESALNDVFDERFKYEVSNIIEHKFKRYLYQKENQGMENHSLIISTHRL